MGNSYSYGLIRVLPELDGKPWDAIAESYLRACRPSYIRVIEHNQGVKSDARCWRVTVYLTAERNVDRVEQEVEVDLPDGVRNGHELHCQLLRVKSAVTYVDGPDGESYGYVNLTNMGRNGT